MKQNAKQVASILLSQRNDEYALVLQKFFKTAKGEYGEGDRFLGIKVPQVRKIAKLFCALPLCEISKLLYSKWHEARSTGLIILTRQFKKANQKEKTQFIDFYLAHLECVNNWDLVDISAYNILGEFLKNKKERKVLSELASQDDLWKKRVAIVATFVFIKNGDFKDILKLTLQLCSFPHDLIHKALGWMLREVGKKDKKVLLDFLETHIQKLPKVTISYTLERCTDVEKKKLRGKLV